MIQSNFTDLSDTASQKSTTNSSTVEETLERVRKTLEHSQQQAEERKKFKEGLEDTKKSTQAVSNLNNYAIY